MADHQAAGFLPEILDAVENGGVGALMLGTERDGLPIVNEGETEAAIDGEETKLTVAVLHRLDQLAALGVADVFGDGLGSAAGKVTLDQIVEHGLLFQKGLLS